MTYIFGYGSLIDTRCRQHTFPGEQAYPARLKGYRRYWSRLTDSSRCCAVAICPEQQASVNGVLIPFDEAYLEELDQREIAYQRVEVNLEQLDLLEPGVPKPSKIYTYIAESVQPPSQQTPIAQSYLDMCLRGCFQFGHSFAQEFLESTHNWGEWINDRHQPTYIRAETLTEKAESSIDQLLYSLYPDTPV